MGRRQSREAAMQILFQVEVGRIEPNDAFQSTAAKAGLSDSMQEFTRRLVFGTLSNKENIDKIISELSKSWRFERIANIDKTIMRMALYEILFEEEIPLNVSVNEAIELAKVFSGEESGKFVNGIIGKVVENPEIYRFDSGEKLKVVPIEL